MSEAKPDDIVIAVANALAQALRECGWQISTHCSRRSPTLYHLYEISVVLGAYPPRAFHSRVVLTYLRADCSEIGPFLSEKEDDSQAKFNNWYSIADPKVFEYISDELLKVPHYHKYYASHGY